MAENMTNNQNVAVRDDDGIRLLDVMIVLAKNKWRILSSGFLAGTLAGALSLLIPNQYTAKAQLLPPQSQSNSSALLGQLGALGGLASASMGIKSPNDMYVGILGSRRVSDSLIQRFHLQQAYNTDLPTDTRRKLQKLSSIVSEKNGMIVVEVTDKNPKLAAALANGYVEELQKLTQILAVTEASQRRLFFEKQVLQAKQGFSEAELALKQVQEKTGLIQLNSQAASIIQAAAAIKAQIASKEVALGAMRTFATSDNPEFIRTSQEISGLKAQLAKAETGLNMGNGDISIATSKVPEAGLEYLRKMRDVKYFETIFELLAKQFELAKIDEAKEGSVIQILDNAVEPDKKSGPARAFIILGAAVFASFMAMCWSFARETSSRNADDGERWRILRAHLRLGRGMAKS